MKSLYLLSLGIFFFAFTVSAREVPVVRKDTMPLRTIIVIFDGLRPDYITPEQMPRLYAFSVKAAYARDNHSVFPTVTRVNAASYATGAYPSGHGLLGNAVYLPEVNRQMALSTGNAGSLRHAMELTSGNLLTAPALGEILGETGEEMYVYSSGTTGQAYLQNHTVNGAVINTGMILPRFFRELLTASIGRPPEDSAPNTARHQWITDALCRYTLAARGPLVSAIWYSDPDAAAHRNGIGEPATIAALKAVDTQFGRILDSINNRGLDQQFNIIVTADHGFVTHTGKQNLTGFLVQEGLKKSSNSDDVIVADGALYIKGRDPELIKRIVAALQQQEWVGAVFTKGVKPGSMKGVVNGTLSFESVHWNHPRRAADILVAVNWNKEKNTQGYAGTDLATGVAGHGGASPYEIHIPLLAYGPSFKQAFVSSLPTSNVDIVPTILHTLHLTPPVKMQGRVMHELLRHSRIKAFTPRKEVIVSETKLKTGSYKITLESTIFGKHRYVNYVSVSRVMNRNR